MDYNKIYNELIYKRKHDVLKKSKSHVGEIETHHILPKSLGGDDSKENLVNLTTREHYIAHLLLLKIHENLAFSGHCKTPYFKMLYALTAMMNLWGYTDRIVGKRVNKFNSRLYTALTISIRRHNSELAKLRYKNMDEDQKVEWCNKISEAIKRHYKEFGSNWSGKHHTDATRKKISESAKKRIVGNNPMSGKKWIFNTETGENKVVQSDFITDGKWIDGRCSDFEKYVEKKNLIYDILKINPNSKVSNRMSIKRLLEISESVKKFDNNQPTYDENTEDRNSQNEELIEYYKNLYKEYKERGYSGVVEKFGYDKSRANLVQQMKKYVEEYEPSKNRDHSKSRKNNLKTHTAT